MARIPALLVCLCVVGVGRAELLPVSSVRKLAIQSERVVLGSIVDPKTPEKIRVHRVLLGAPAKPTAILEVGGLGEYVRRGRLPVQEFDEVLLFLVGVGENPNSMRVVPSGVRAVTEADRVLTPVQLSNPGPYTMTANEKLEWEPLLAKVEEDCRTLARLHRLRTIEPARRRNRAILAWLERHRSQFSRGSIGRGLGHQPDDMERAGWESMEHLPFHWILDSGIHDDCWRAVRLYSELHGRACLGLSHPAFASPSGRTHLLEVARSESLVRGERIRALRLLASDATLFPEADAKQTPWAKPIGAVEQTKLLEGLTPLMGGRSPTIQKRAAQAVRSVSRLTRDGNGHRPEAVEALSKAYQNLRPNSAREEVSEALRAVAGTKRWQELTDHSTPWAIYLQQMEGTNNALDFWLSVAPAGDVVSEQPTVELQRLNLIGWVKEKRSFPLPAPKGFDWKTGWKTTRPLHARVDVNGFEPGIWRIVIKGVIGKDRTKWSSEPRRFRVVDDSKAYRTYPSNRKPLKLIFLDEID